MAINLKGAGDWVAKQLDVQSVKAASMTKLKSNEAINKLGDKTVNIAQKGSYLGGIGASYKNMRNDINLIDAINLGHRTADGSLNMGAIAGSYVGVSTGFRALSGGGAYRDRNGNANIAGIPFV